MFLNFHIPEHVVSMFTIELALSVVEMRLDMVDVTPFEERASVIIEAMSLL